MLEACASPEIESGSRERPFFTYDTHPDRYVHWKLSFEGSIATLTLDVSCPAR